MVSTPGLMGSSFLKEQVGALRTFTNSIPYKVPRSVYERIVQASSATMAWVHGGAGGPRWPG